MKRAGNEVTSAVLAFRGWTFDEDGNQEGFEGVETSKPEEKSAHRYSSATGEGGQPGDGAANGLKSPDDDSDNYWHSYRGAKTDGLLGEKTERRGNARSEAGPHDEADRSISVERKPCEIAAE